MKDERYKLIEFRSNSLFYAARTRAKKKGLDFNLTKEWVMSKIQEGKCEITGFTLVMTLIGEFKLTRKLNPYAPSLDRIDSTKGYTPENTQIVISAVNKFKSDMIQHELIPIAKAVVTKHMSTRQFIVNR